MSQIQPKRSQSLTGVPLIQRIKKLRKERNPYQIAIKSMILNDSVIDYKKPGNNLINLDERRAKYYFHLGREGQKLYNQNLSKLLKKRNNITSRISKMRKELIHQGGPLIDERKALRKAIRSMILNDSLIDNKKPGNKLTNLEERRAKYYFNLGPQDQKLYKQKLSEYEKKRKHLTSIISKIR